MIEEILLGFHTSIILTNAASAAGKIMIKNTIPIFMSVINIVNNKQEKDDLKMHYGLLHVVRSDKPNFQSKLLRFAKETKPTAAFDFKGGEIGKLVFLALEDKGVFFSVSDLKTKPINDVPVEEFIFKQKQIKALDLKR